MRQVRNETSRRAKLSDRESVGDRFPLTPDRGLAPYTFGQSSCLTNTKNINIRGSSNGRTPGFGPGYRGSNPCPRDNFKRSVFAGLLKLLENKQ